MDTEQIRIAAAVARHGSFTGAARELFMAQSTVSRQIAALEKDLGVLLFTRRPRRAETTSQGRAFLAAAEEVLAAVERAVDEARCVRGPADAVDKA